MLYASRYDEIMTPCWAQKATKRPSMSEVAQNLDKLFHGAAGDSVYYEEDVVTKVSQSNER